MISEALFLLVGVVGLVLVIVLIAKRAEHAVLLVLASELLTSRFILPTISAGSLTLYVADFVAPALLVATALRPYLGVKRRRIHPVLLALLALTLLGVARGIRVFGLQVAGNGAREILAFTAAGVFFSTVSITPRFIDGTRRWFMVAGGFTVLIAVLYWIQNGFGGFTSVGGRALRGLDALILLAATIIAIVVPYGRTRTRNLALPSIGFVVLVLSVQRSVAIAGILALIVIVLVGGRLRTRRSSLVTRLLLAIGGLSIVFLVFTGPAGLTQDLGTAVSTSAAEEGTFVWRIQGWQILIGNQVSGSVPSILIGEPAGSSNLRIIGESVVTVGPHSEYVSLFKSTGIIGLGIMLWLLISTFRRNLMNTRSDLTFTATVGLLFTALLTAQVTYFVTYSVGLIAGLVVGLAVSLAWFGAVDPEAEERVLLDPDSIAPEPAVPGPRWVVGSSPRRSAPPPIDRPTLA